MKILETERLVLREFRLEDAPFLLELMNTQGWLAFIGDRGIRTENDAKAYFQTRIQQSYLAHGFGLWAMERKEGELVGMCGLVRRDTLPFVDVGYAILPAFEGKGYAFEAGKATIEYAFEVLGLNTLLAITSQDNARSIRLLERLGFAGKELHKPADEEEELFCFSLSKPIV